MSKALGAPRLPIPPHLNESLELQCARPVVTDVKNPEGILDVDDHRPRSARGACHTSDWKEE